MTVRSEVADYFNMNLTDDPYWSESSWFSWHIPEKNINGAFYNHFRPNMSCMLAGVFMWDNSGHLPWTSLFFDWQAMRVLPKGRFGRDYNKYDFETPWGMSIKMLKPLKRYHLKYDREGFRLDLVFEGVAEPNEIGAKNAHGLNRAYNFHFEQPGRIKGTVACGDAEHHVDSFCIRDGSHGPRFLETVTPGGYTWSTADEKAGWHVLAVDADRNRDTKIVGGYILRDGKMAPIARGVRRVLERNGPRPSLVEVIAEDELGRSLHATGRDRVTGEWMLFPDRGMWWQQFAWDYDGHADAVGEDQEYYGLHDFRRWNRADPALWKTR
jgi:hypothetical protein